MRWQGTYLLYSNAKVSWICEHQHQWEEKINNRTAKGLGCPFCAGVRPIPGINDLASIFPRLKNEWDYRLNGDLKPSDVFPQSNIVVNWVCGRNHRWKAKICHRTAGRGCPYCAGNKPIAGETDLQSCRPDIAQQWCHEKNNGSTPADFTQHSHYLAWWKCENGHEYQSPIYRRTRGCGCPICDGKKIIPHVNDLASYVPELALEWDYRNNGDLTPTQVAPHSNTLCSRICKTCGYAWTASPNNRIAGSGCPKCAGFCVDPEINSFAAMNPSLINQWDLVRNQPLTAWDVAAYDNRTYQWICENGHLFSATPANRTKGTSCPYCVGKLPVVGVNDLLTLHPELAKHWSTPRNKRGPEMYFADSSSSVWWKCEADHVFRAPVREMTLRWRCPKCEQKRTAPWIK